MGQRASRVGEELRKIVTQVLREDITDPRLGFVTVTHVKVTDDLRMGRIYFSVLGDEDQKKDTAEALQEHTSEIRRLVAERINMKFAMEIRFEPDPSIENSFRIDEILKRIKKNEGGQA